MELRNIALRNLRIANVNVSHGRKAPDISDILPSSVADIAQTFGQTERYIKQRLALAGLNSTIKEAYRSGDIEPEELQLLASATRSQQKDWVAAFEAENGPDGDVDGAPRGHQLKQWLFGSERIATTAALFALEAYKGEIVTDLFGDSSYFADSAGFWTLQNAAIAGLRDDRVGKGWKVTVLDKGTRFPSWQYDEVPLEDGGEAFIEVRNNGEVEVHEGYRPYVSATIAGATAADLRGTTSYASATANSNVVFSGAAGGTTAASGTSTLGATIGTFTGTAGTAGDGTTALTGTITLRGDLQRGQGRGDRRRAASCTTRTHQGRRELSCPAPACRRPCGAAGSPRHCPAPGRRPHDRKFTALERQA